MHIILLLLSVPCFFFGKPMRFRGQQIWVCQCKNTVNTTFICAVNSIKACCISLASCLVSRNSLFRLCLWEVSLLHATSTTVIVPKECTDTVKLCVNLTKLKESMQRTNFPLSSAGQQLVQLAGAAWCSQSNI